MASERLLLRALLLLSLAAPGCRGAPPERPTPAPAAAASSAPARPSRVVLSIVGTNDLHGHISALPWLGGYVANLRAARAADGGVLLVDAGDMFQGTLESNLVEGASVVDGYNALGYAAAAVGNHEFDFGPEGEAATARTPADDPRGALKALAKRATFPFLCANLQDSTTHAHPAWPHMPKTALVEIAGVKVGLVGVSTEHTAQTTIAANFRGLEMAPLAKTTATEATALRARGANVVVLLAHAGTKCHKFTGDAAADGCDMREEIVGVAEALPRGAVDVIVAGHTHAAVAHRLAGVPVVESYSYGRAFGRVDLVVERGAVTSATIHAPHDLCHGKPPAPDGADVGPCDAGSYEGKPVLADPRVKAAVLPGLAVAAKRRGELLGPVVSSPIPRSYDHPSPLGDLFADLLRDATRADVALMNGGGLRASVPAGPLTYGALFEAFPFDNRIARVKMTGKELRGLLTRHVRGAHGGILSVSGVRVVARCKQGKLDVDVTRDSGKPLGDTDELVVAMSDFLATGGDSLLVKAEHEGRTTIDETLARDAMVAELAKRRTLDPATFYDAARPRIALPDGRRPARCGH